MAAWTNKKIIHRTKTLPVIELRLGHRHFCNFTFAHENLRHNLIKILRSEGQKHPFPTQGIRIDPNQRLSIQILEHIRHQAILADSHDCVLWPEDKVGYKRTVYYLNTAMAGQKGFSLPHDALIDSILALVIRKIRSQMLHIKSRLIFCVEPSNEFIQSCASRYDDNLVFRPTLHYSSGLR